MPLPARYSELEEGTLLPNGESRVQYDFTWYFVYEGVVLHAWLAQQSEPVYVDVLTVYRLGRRYANHATDQVERSI